MAYNSPVKFTRTNQFGCGPDNEDDVYTIKEFHQHCHTYAFIDDDGWGYPVKDKMADKSIAIRPSRLDLIPEDATHIVWLNK